MRCACFRASSSAANSSWLRRTTSARAAHFLTICTPYSPNFLQGRNGTKSLRKGKGKAKAASNDAGAFIQGVMGAVGPVYLSISLCYALIRPQQALASAHTAAPALCTCTRNHTGWSVGAVVRAMSVRGGDPMRVCGSLDPAQAGSNGTCCGRRKRLWLHAQAGARMASNAVCCR